MQGLSPRNLGYMKAFAEAWPEESILQVALAKITWYHNLTLLEKVKSSEERLVRRANRRQWVHLQSFLLELGIGFAFVGNQYPLEVAGDDYKIDLLSHPLQIEEATCCRVCTEEHNDAHGYSGISVS